jgi:hypothetical protein
MLPDHPYELRVVAFDEAVVMYDMRWTPQGPWAMAKLARSFAYYRIGRDFFEAHARCIGIDPLSDRELAVHRPALPFAVAQRADLSWYESWDDIDSGVTNAAAALPVSVIYLSPFGPRDTDKPAVMLQADNGEFFTEVELLLKAKSLQAPHIGTVLLTNGVGIYREGIKKQTPSYYIWGAQSRLDAPAVNLAHAARTVAQRP